MVSLNTDRMSSRWVPPVAELTADDRADRSRRVGVHGDDRFAASVNDDGAVLLTPLASIPRRELLVWENEELRASLLRGTAEASVTY